MSWLPEAVVISGYKISREFWKQGFEYCEDHDILDLWEDFFIDMDPMRDSSETFFGAIIYKVDEYTPAQEFETIVADASTIHSIQDGFEKIFRPIYRENGIPIPLYGKYLGIRWI